MNWKGFFAFTLFVNIAFAAHIDLQADTSAIEVSTETTKLNPIADIGIISASSELETGRREGTEENYDQEQDYIPEETEYYPENPDYPDEGTPDYYDDYFDSYYYDEGPRGTNENM